MSEGERKDGWPEYSKLVISELHRLSDISKDLYTAVNSIKDYISDTRNTLNEVENLKTWKGNIDEVASPTQLNNLIEDVNKLKEFKTRSITVFVVIQTLIVIALAILKII